MMLILACCNPLPFPRPPLKTHPPACLVQVFLVEHCEGAVRVDLKPGDTLFVPPGWIRASATTSACISLGGTYLRSSSLALHLEGWHLEEHLGAQPGKRYPMFKQLLWYAAAGCVPALQAAAALPGAVLEGRVAGQLVELEEEIAAAAAAAGAAALGAKREYSVLGTASKAGIVGGAEEDVADDAATATRAPRAATAMPSARHDVAGRGAGQGVKAPVTIRTRQVATPTRQQQQQQQLPLAVSGRKRRRGPSPVDDFVASDDEVYAFSHAHTARCCRA
jgi:hypothetical protein